ncbi:OprD family outer membrane porin [Pontiella sulfatireligans]|uniref:Porin D n=1 Tax=Pontiella sulfatireligans TaxID=2750658 RepID=A0A6C2USY6_9BACT|nr:OprD family outer membrane porin [Pontiella sulfatireligans]VGO23450.1 Porin D [Pontiella sulfatireligans]
MIRFLIGASYYRSDKISGDSDEGGTGLLAPIQKSYDVLGEAYVALRHEEHKMTLYRQIIDLPYLNKSDSRMVPNTFEAYMLRGLFRDQPVVGDVEYAAGYVDQIKRKTSDSFISMAQAAGAVGVDRGLFTAGIAIQPTTNFLIGAVDHYVDDVFNTLYLESNYTRELTDDLDLRFDTQFTHQQSVGDELLIGDDFSTWMLSGRLAASWKGLMCTAAAAKINEDARIRNPYGSYPGFVSLMQSDFNSANEESWLLGVSYDFERVGLKGLSSFVNYARGNNAQTSSGADLPDTEEVNITADYKVDEGILRGFWLRVRWSHLDFSGDAGNSDELRVILNYEFPIL